MPEIITPAIASEMPAALPDYKKLHTGLAARFQEIRTRTELFCKPLQAEDYVVQPVVDVSPPKWHLAHSTWFFEQFVLREYLPGYQEFNSAYGFLFNSYYETLGRRVLRTNRGNLTRPAVAEVYAYRKHVNTHILELLQQNHPLPEAFYTAFELGLQHEQQHQELLVTDTKFILGHNPLFPALHAAPAQAEAGNTTATVEFLEVEAGMHQIGFQGTGFCFDNELGVHPVFLPAFAIRQQLVTNAEYLEFMEAGGYANFANWLAEGWDWVRQHQAEAPLYWHSINGKWHYYTLSGLAPVNPDAPVTHVNFYEADAFARWKNLRLPTEFEWEAACRKLQPELPAEANFLNSGNYQPQPERGLQLWGNCWEWTNSAYLPYPYYQKAEGALGEYNGKFMINQMVLRGGSCATPANHFRPSYRNFFHPHLQWQFTGIRLAKHL